MSKGVIGIDISDRSIEMVLLEGRGSDTVKGIAHAELPVGTVTRGAIGDFDYLLNTLNGLLDGMLGARRPKLPAAVALPESLVYSKVFTLPSVLDREQTAQALAIESAEEFPCDTGTQAVTDFAETFNDGDGTYKTYLFGMTDARSAADYEKLLEYAGLVPEIIEPESVAITRATLSDGEGSNTLIADIGARTSILIVLGSAGEPILSAAVPVGGDILTEAIANRLGMTFDQAETLKRKAGFDPEVEEGRVMMILQRPFDEIISEIGRTLEYHREVTGERVSRIVLTGGTSLCPKIDEYLASQFDGIRIDLGRPFANVKFAEDAVLPSGFRGDSVLYSAALGLAQRLAGTRGRPGPNLLPSAVQAGKRALSMQSLFKKFASLMPRTKKKTPSKKSPAEKKMPSISKDEPPPQERQEEPAVVPHEMPASKPTPEPELKTEPAPAPAIVPVSKTEPKPVVEQKMTEVAPVSSTPGLESIKDALAGLNDAAVAPPTPADTKESAPVDSHEASFGMGVGDLLGASGAVGQKAGEEADTGDDYVGISTNELLAEQAAAGGEKLSIEDILKGKTLPAAKPSSPATKPQPPAKTAAPAAKPVVAARPATGTAPRPRQRHSRLRLVIPLLFFVVAVLLILQGAGIIGFLRDNGIAGLVSRVQTLVGFGKSAPTVPESQVPDSGPKIPEAVSLNLLVSPDGEGEDMALPVVKSRVIETDVVANGNFEATGEAQSGDTRAVGMITIVNELPRAFRFVERTRFLSSDGVLFRMKKSADIPASGSVDVEVYADEVGPSGDLAASRFTIPGLSADLQKSVYGVSRTAMSGGSGTVVAVSASDLSAAHDKLVAQLLEEAKGNFASMVTVDEKLLDDLMTSREIGTESPEEGTKMTQFSMKVTVRFRALVVPEKEIVAMLEEKLPEKLPEGVSADNYSLGTPHYTVEAYDTTTDRAEIRAEAALDGVEPEDIVAPTGE